MLLILLEEALGTESFQSFLTEFLSGGRAGLTTTGLLRAF